VLCLNTADCSVLDATMNYSNKNSAEWLGFGAINGKTLYSLSIPRKKQWHPAGIQEACFFFGRLRSCKSSSVAAQFYKVNLRFRYKVYLFSSLASRTVMRW
jgi:hypothetical protein